jgi:hypothetical protein
VLLDVGVQDDVADELEDGQDASDDRQDDGDGFLDRQQKTFLFKGILRKQN